MEYVNHACATYALALPALKGEVFVTCCANSFEVRQRTKFSLVTQHFFN